MWLGFLFVCLFLLLYFCLFVLGRGRGKAFISSSIFGDKCIVLTMLYLAIVQRGAGFIMISPQSSE